MNQEMLAEELQVCEDRMGKLVVAQRPIPPELRKRVSVLRMQVVGEPASRSLITGY